MNRREFVKAAGIQVLFAGSLLRAVENNQKQAPNIVFIFSDDHALQSIGAYGSIINKTPNIDRIAKDGAVFDRCFCGNSICGPSRATVLTGKFSHINGFKTNSDKFDGSQQTLPKLLKKAGYQTALFGKWHLVSEPTGFDEWQILPGQGSYYNPDFISVSGKARVNGYVTDIITDKSLDWLKNKRDPKKPFLLMCQNKAPHRSWMPNLKHLELYEDIEIPEPETLYDDYSGRSSVLKENEMEIGRHMYMDADLKVTGSKVKNVLGRATKNHELDRMTPEQRKQWDAIYNPRNAAFEKANLTGKDLFRWKYQRYVKDYLRCVASVDENVGRVLDYLDESGLSENTLVVYSSDQGFYLGEHGWFDKRWMYEESFRMPFIARWPGQIKSGTHISALSQNIDFAPTFLEAAGLSIPKDMQGVSLKPLFNGEKPADWRQAIYYHYYEKGIHNVAPHFGVRTDRYKLLCYYETGEWELFDLQEDLHELKSVYDRPEYKDIQKMMHEKLKQLQTQYRDEV